MAIIAQPTNFLLSLAAEEMNAIRNALVDWEGLWPGRSFSPDSVDTKRQSRSLELKFSLLESIEAALMTEWHEEQERFGRNLAEHTR